VCWPNGADLDPLVLYALITQSSADSAAPPGPAALSLQFGWKSPNPLQVSVLIVSYTARRLRACLTSLEASADRDKMEVLVVDSGSFDRTPEVVADFPQTILLKLPATSASPRPQHRHADR